jgi:ferredoxin
MPVNVDQALCTGCGYCVDICPEAFALGDDGKAVVTKQFAETCNLEEVADNCPVEAIDI